MTHYVDRYWALRRMKREIVRRDEFNCLDPDPRDIPEVEDEDEECSAEIAALKLETHCGRHTPRLSDEYE